VATVSEYWKRNLFSLNAKQRVAADTSLNTYRIESISRHARSALNGKIFILLLSRFKWAKIVVSLERAVSQKNAHNYLQEYSIKLSGGDANNPASEQRGVLIIKSKSKTKAKQRKGAVANWKVIYSLIFILSLSLSFSCRGAGGDMYPKIYSASVHQASEFIYRPLPPRIDTDTGIWYRLS